MAWLVFAIAHVVFSALLVLLALNVPQPVILAVGWTVMATYATAILLTLYKPARHELWSGSPDELSADDEPGAKTSRRLG